METKKILLVFFLVAALISFSSNSARASKVCLSWDWQDPDYPFPSAIEFRVYYSELPGPPFIGNYVNQGASPFVAALLNTNGYTWSTCIDMPTLINSYITVTAFDTASNLESTYSNTVYVDFSVPTTPSDNVPFQIQWSD